MKIKIDEFRISDAQPVDVPLDFTTLCALIAAHQAATPTAKLARDGETPADHGDHGNPAVAVLLAAPGQEAPAGAIPGSFHRAAAARVNGESR